jgi:hypothetical protein
MLVFSAKNSLLLPLSLTFGDNLMLLSQEAFSNFPDYIRCLGYMQVKKNCPTPQTDFKKKSKIV